MGLFDSLVELTTEAVSVIVAPVEIVADVASVIVKPIAEVTEDIVDEVKNLKG